MGASLALAGLSACSGPAETIVPYVRAPEDIVPGRPLFFATAMSLGGIATGVLAESHMGRPTKIEGNSDHPASLGATDAFAQASILTLYDPERSQVVSQAGLISTWTEFQAALAAELETQRQNQGAGLRILTETVTSPTLADQLQTILAEFPQAQWHQYEPVNRDNVWAGAELAFGEPVETQVHFDQAEVVLALDADFMAPGPGHLRYARDFMDRRRVRAGQADMNRLYVVESTPTITGSMADHRLPLRAGQIETLARAVAQALDLIDGDSRLTDRQSAWVSALVDDLSQHQGSSLVIVGAGQPPVVHALAHAINAALGNVDTTVSYTDPVEANPVNQTESLQDLVEAMAAGQVELLLLVGGNPVYNAPVDLAFGEAMDNVKFKVHLGLYDDETAFLCNWHLPQTHYLESWSDGRAFDGTVTIMQPLIAPLYDGHSAHELLALLPEEPAGRTGRDIVQVYWQGQNRADNFEQFWQKALNDGVVPDTALPARTVSLRADLASKLSQANAADSAGLELIFRPDPAVWDGRFANNGWLQELPKPLTKLIWDNAALVSPTTATALGVVNADVIRLTYQGRSVDAPVWIMPGHPDEAITIHLGYGRYQAGNVGQGVGFNAYALRTTAALWFDTGLEVTKTGRTYALATTQDHYSMEGRDLVQVGTLAAFKEQPEFVHEETPHDGELSLYPAFEYKGNAWGMAIDLTACNGCNACVVACQAENNIPIVGKEQVLNGREMHWIRIDRYFEGDLDNPDTYHRITNRCCACSAKMRRVKSSVLSGLRFTVPRV